MSQDRRKQEEAKCCFPNKEHNRSLKVSMQRRILVMCWLGYMFSYLGKTNLSIIIPDLVLEFGWTKAQIGVAGTLFFWTYSIGQLLNGFLGDRFHPKYMIGTGLLISSMINMMMGFNCNYLFFLVLWSLNGAALSVLWGPMVRMISDWFEAGEREKTGFTMSFTVIVGYLCSWGLIGLIASYSSWQWAFWIPSVIIFLFAIVWFCVVVEHPSKKAIVINYHGMEASCDRGDRVVPHGATTYGTSLNSTSHGTSLNSTLHGTSQNGTLQDTTPLGIKKTQESPALPFLSVMKKEYLWIYGLIGALQGFIKEGVSFWGPTIISDTRGPAPQNALLDPLFSLCIPLLGGFGIYFSKRILKRSNSENRCNQILMTLGIFASMMLIITQQSIIGTALSLGVLSALMFGVNALISTVIPLKFAKYQKVSAVTGFLNFSCYMGATFGGVICGMANDYFGWIGIYSVFMILCIIAILLSKLRNHLKTD